MSFTSGSKQTDILEIFQLVFFQTFTNYKYTSDHLQISVLEVQENTSLLQFKIKFAIC